MDFFVFFGFLSKLLRLLLKVTKVTTGHKKLPKMGQNSIISSEGRSPPQELEVGPRSGPYLLVDFKNKIYIQTNITLNKKVYILTQKMAQFVPKTQLFLNVTLLNKCTLYQKVLIWTKKYQLELKVPVCTKSTHLY